MHIIFRLGGDFEFIGCNAHGNKGHGISYSPGRPFRHFRLSESDVKNNKQLGVILRLPTNYLRLSSHVTVSILNNTIRNNSLGGLGFPTDSSYSYRLVTFYLNTVRQPEKIFTFNF